MGVRSHILARVYDRVLAGTEAAGLRELRAALVGRVSGHTVEIGAGTGLNLALYPSELDLIAAEPDEAMRARLAKRARHIRPQTRVEPWPAEALAVDDGSVDTVLSTLVLCTVSELEATVDEIRRVLRPGGRFLFLEHVRSGDPGVARLQRALRGPWRFCAVGCTLDRQPLALLDRAGFAVEAMPVQIPRAPRFLTEAVMGAATAV